MSGEQLIQDLASLPKGWRWVTLREISNIAGGVTKGQKNRPTEILRRVPYLRVANVQRGYLDLTEIKEIDVSETAITSLSLRAGDILFNEGGDRDKLGRGWVWNGELQECVHQNHVFRARLTNSLDNPKFISYYGNSAGQKYFFDQGKQTTNLASINITKLGSLPIPLPTPDQQQRIVAEIEKQFTRLDAGVNALLRVTANLKRYRAATLKAACEGRLVPTEAELARVENRNANFESGEALLARILTERRKSWNGRGLYKEPSAPDTSTVGSLPDGWTWARLEQLGTTFGGLTKNPKRANLPKQLPYLRVANVYANELRLKEIECIGVEDSEIEKLLVRVGDLLIVEGNGSKDQIGRMAIWDGSIDPCVHQNHIIKVRLTERWMPKWISTWLQSPNGRQFVELVASSTSGLYTLSVNKVGNLPIALPPLAEQKRIVAEVERRLSVVEELEALVAANHQRTIRLRQTILQKAFTGCLIEQVKL